MSTPTDQQLVERVAELMGWTRVQDWRGVQGSSGNVFWEEHGQVRVTHEGSGRHEEFNPLAPGDTGWADWGRFWAWLMKQDHLLAAVDSWLALWRANLNVADWTPRRALLLAIYRAHEET